MHRSIPAEVCLLLALGLSVAHFHGCAPVHPSDPHTTVTAGSCPAACEHLRLIGCEAGSATPNGASCEDVCEYVEGSGVGRWNLGCLGAAESCAVADACLVSAE